MTTTTLAPPPNTTTTLAPPPALERADTAPDEKPPPPRRDFTIPRRPRPAQPEPYKFDVHQYHEMFKAGILTSDDRVELIRGEIIAMSAIGNEHMATVDSSNRFWSQAIGVRAIVRIQGSVRLDEGNEPQPDVTLLKNRDDFYRSRSAGPWDILLIVEVSDSSLAYDRGVKLKLYAEFEVPEVWIANIRARTIEAYTDPSNGEYTTLRTFRPGQTVSPAAFPDVALPVADVIGAAADA